MFQMLFFHLGVSYNHILNSIIVDACFKFDPFLLISLKLTFQSNDNASNSHR